MGGEEVVAATAGTMIACDADMEHGACAGSDKFLVLCNIAPRP